MPPAGVKSAKRKRQYQHIKESERARGVGEDRAEEIAARTVNKQRAQAGETKGRGRKKNSRSSSTRKGRSSSRTSSTSSRTTSAAGRTSSSRGRKTKRAQKKR